MSEHWYFTVWEKTSGQYLVDTCAGGVFGELAQAKCWRDLGELVDELDASEIDCTSMEIRAVRI